MLIGACRWHALVLGSCDNLQRILAKALVGSCLLACWGLWGALCLSLLLFVYLFPRRSLACSLVLPIAICACLPLSLLSLFLSVCSLLLGVNVGSTAVFMFTLIVVLQPQHRPLLGLADKLIYRHPRTSNQLEQSMLSLLACKHAQFSKALNLDYLDPKL